MIRKIMNENEDMQSDNDDDCWGENVSTEEVVSRMRKAMMNRISKV